MNYEAACEWIRLDPKVEIDEVSLKKAYRKAAILEHPDKSSHEDATSRFQSVKRAHECLEHCVERGETGENADLECMDDRDDGVPTEEEFRRYEAEIRRMYTAHIIMISRIARLKRQRYGEQMGGIPFEMGTFSSNDMEDMPFEFFPDGFDEEGFEKLQREREEELEQMYENMEEEERLRKEELRRHHYQIRKEVRKEERARREQFEKEEIQRRMSFERKRAHAMKEGREFFESWSVAQLKQECRRRGLSTKGLQQKSLVEVLIVDEAKKRHKRELKEIASFLDKWVEIIGQPHLNGIRARAVDFNDGKQVIPVFRDG